MPASQQLQPSPGSKREPWSVDRWGRLMAGSTVLLATGLGVFVHPAWLLVTGFSALNLIITSLTGSCPLNKILIRLGAREREDLFWPGGEPRIERDGRPSESRKVSGTVEALGAGHVGVRSSRTIRTIGK